MKAYKGFNPDMKCRGFQYEEGKEYTTEKAKCCNSGFHACEYPLDCLDYYEPNKSVYHEVEVDGDIDHDGCDTKVAATKIKIGARLSIAGLVKAAIDYTMKRIKPEAKADENHAACSATGDKSACSATGDNSACSADNPTAVAVAWGIHGKARGVLGAHIVLADWRMDEDCDWYFHGAKMVRIDGKRYKPDTWYRLDNGKVVEVKGEEA